jgi:hypothetical protein
MNINPDYMAVMRTGARITRTQYRKQIESGIVVFWCMFAGLSIVLTAILTGGF